MFDAKGSRKSSHADGRQEFASEAGIRVEDVQPALGDYTCAVHADAARGHAAVLGFDDDGYPARPQPFVDGAGDLVRQTLLYLETPRASFDNLTPPTSTSGAARSLRWKGKGSNAKPSISAACFIEKRQPNMTTLMGQSLR